MIAVKVFHISPQSVVIVNDSLIIVDISINEDRPMSNIPDRQNAVLKSMKKLSPMYHRLQMELNSGKTWGILEAEAYNKLVNSNILFYPHDLDSLLASEVYWIRMEHFSKFGFDADEKGCNYVDRQYQSTQN